MRTVVMQILVSLVSGALACGQAKPSQEAEIARFIEKYDKAWNHKDAAVIDRILSPDYVYFSSKGQVRTRQSLLEEFMSPEYNLASAERSEVKVYVTLSTAVVSSRWKGHGTFEGREFHDDQRCSIVLARRNRDWLVVSEHCTQIAAP